MVIWLTGLSGAGKTTLSSLFNSIYKNRLPELVLIDGDEVREIFDDNLGYKEDDRYKQIIRIQRLAGVLEKQGLFVVVSALYAHPELLKWNRENYIEYFEVYLDASIALVSRRDPKGLYAKAANGGMPDVVGIDVAWHPPEEPDISIKMDVDTKPEQAIQLIVESIPFLRELEKCDRS